MYKQIKMLSTLIFIGFLMAACGSSGGSSGGSGGGGGGGGGGSSSLTHLFYKSGSISRIDPSNPGATPVVVEIANTTGETKIASGTLNLTNKSLSDIHARSIVYANTDTGKLYKISALKSDSQNPVQISNEAGASVICGTDEETDFSDHGKSVFFYKLPGADSNCFNGDEIWKMVRMNMGTSETPIMAKEWKLGILNPNTGELEGFLAINGNTLERCDQNFQNCSNVISFSSNVEALENNFSNNAMLQVDNQLFHYDTVSGVLSSALHTFSGVSPSLVQIAADEAIRYFADGDQIFSLPIDGSALATPFSTETGNTISQVTLTTNKLVYITKTLASPPLSVLKAIDKSNSAMTTLIPSTTDDLFFFNSIAGDFILYGRFPSGGGSVRGTIKDDGTSASEIPDASWTGFTGSSTSSKGVDIDRVVWLEGCGSFGNCAGATIHSVDAETNSGELSLGTIPSDVSAINFFNTGGENNLLGGGLATGLESDIFLIDPNQANSLTRITDTPGFSEQLIN